MKDRPGGGQTLWCDTEDGEGCNFHCPHNGIAKYLAESLAARWPHLFSNGLELEVAMFAVDYLEAD
ncbi:hypothetical protein OG474_30570 [Kribbella sp. NBC_01505]|uniref:hypothetical protein n=1 Tax=Kribbella sp. NBC_01505 TaxID=2903580 RepID=UPI003868ABA1